MLTHNIWKWKEALTDQIRQDQMLFSFLNEHSVNKKELLEIKITNSQRKKFNVSLEEIFQKVEHKDKEMDNSIKKNEREKIRRPT